MALQTSELELPRYTFGIVTHQETTELMTRGSIRVSFAGTYQEAKNFARDIKGITAPKGLAHHGDEDLPMLCAAFKSDVERREKSDLLTRLGWDPEFQITTSPGEGYNQNDKRPKRARAMA